MISTIQEQLARDEGRRRLPYKDTDGHWTIGCGHYLGATIPPQFANGITETQIDKLFDADLHHVWDLLDVYLPWWSSLDQTSGPRSNVLVNMGFNLGVVGLSHFTTFLNFMRARNWESAAEDLRLTKVYSQLPARYERLCQQVVDGTWK